MSESPSPPESSTPKVLAAIVIAAAASTVGYVAQNALVHSEATTAAVYDSGPPSPVTIPTVKAIIQTEQVYGGTP